MFLNPTVRHATFFVFLSMFSHANSNCVPLRPCFSFLLDRCIFFSVKRIRLTLTSEKKENSSDVHVSRCGHRANSGNFDFLNQMHCSVAFLTSLFLSVYFYTPLYFSVATVADCTISSLLYHLSSAQLVQVFPRVHLNRVARWGRRTIDPSKKTKTAVARSRARIHVPMWPGNVKILKIIRKNDGSLNGTCRTWY